VSYPNNLTITTKANWDPQTKTYSVQQEYELEKNAD
jgi:hypothetical protein